MRDLLDKIFIKLDKKVEKRYRDAISEGFLFDPHFNIKILGQMSLLANESVAVKFDLFATADVDAYIKGEHWTKKELELLLKKENLELDSDSNLIWVPDESKYLPLFTGKYITVEVIAPLYCLASKAVKAKEKNKGLIMEALLEYGKELEKLVEKHGGDLEYFYE